MRLALLALVLGSAFLLGACGDRWPCHLDGFPLKGSAPVEIDIKRRVNLELEDWRISFLSNDHSVQRIHERQNSSIRIVGDYTTSEHAQRIYEDWSWCRHAGLNEEQSIWCIAIGAKDQNPEFLVSLGSGEGYVHLVAEGVSLEGHEEFLLTIIENIDFFVPQRWPF